jgi:rubrerythrin
MKGGIDAWNGLVSRAEVDQGIYLIEGDEDPEEVISLAYGLEEGTYRFYQGLSERSTDGKIRDLFEKLSKAEIQHKENLWENYKTLTGGGITRNAFESGIVLRTMEGGKTADQVLAEYPDWVQEAREALQLAMSLETDALDLYLRMAMKSRHEETKAIFHQISDEEKAHLRKLGRLLRVKLSTG